MGHSIIPVYPKRIDWISPSAKRNLNGVKRNEVDFVKLLQISIELINTSVGKTLSFFDLKMF